jgi:hypothetical protein
MRIYKIFEIFILSSEKIKLKKKAWNAFLFKIFRIEFFQHEKRIKANFFHEMFLFFSNHFLFF